MAHGGESKTNFQFFRSPEASQCQFSRAIYASKTDFNADHVKRALALLIGFCGS